MVYAELLNGYLIAILAPAVPDLAGFGDQHVAVSLLCFPALLSEHPYCLSIFRSALSIISRLLYAVGFSLSVGNCEPAGFAV